ncbi:AAA family ATPase [Bacillus pseudomycoides]|uniref:AAA family ATPase n=1 Tax=Bacillus pseudomycoides TaxID=64104 RepID=UPI000BF85D6A|nr:AAA family ATPase [Bacillus pseudomycoides]PFY88280.1 kinase [Bacillus pseudomycoides]
MDNSKKIWIVGPPGSGKTTLGKELSSVKGINCYSLDEIRWKENWEKTPDFDFLESINAIVNNSEWIIDGYYPGLDKYFNFADEIIYIKTPLLVLITRVCKRSYKRIRNKLEICNGNTENWKFFFSKNGILIYTIKQYFIFNILFQKWKKSYLKVSLRKSH